MAGRPLSPAETALWRRVTMSVRAIDPQPNVENTSAPPNDSRNATAIEDGLNESAPRSRPRPIRSSASSNTLDGSWDKRIATGKIMPDRTIDLHGCTLAQAHRRLDIALGEAVADGARVVLLITGRAPPRNRSRLDAPLRGIIRASVGDWLAASRHAAYIAAVRPAHPRHGGGGALYLIVRRSRI